MRNHDNARKARSLRHQRMLAKAEYQSAINKAQRGGTAGWGPWSPTEKEYAPLLLQIYKDSQNTRVHGKGRR